MKSKLNLTTAAGWFVRYFLLTLWLLIIIIPIVWIFLSAFKPLDEVLKFSIPSKIKIENFIIPYTTRPYPTYYVNSILFATLSTISVLFFCSLAGYGFAKFKFFGRRVFFFMVLSTLMISVHVTMVPLFRIIKNLGMVDTLPGLLAPFMMTGVGVFLMRQFMIVIPEDYIDAARIDGAGEILIFARIIIPLAMPIVSALGVINFIAVWDEFLWPLVIGLSKKRTMTVGLALFVTGFKSPLNQLFAVSVTAVVPMMMAYFIAQRHFVRSLALTGLKE
ncbi:MAG: carbohydrate ABC transporter permease [Spirochaetaceae bacterium]|nr:MAG: carbohydrate ABC transporter permease [Spirochaetaceae bacterium]